MPVHILSGRPVGRSARQINHKSSAPVTPPPDTGPTRPWFGTSHKRGLGATGLVDFEQNVLGREVEMFRTFDSVYTPDPTAEITSILDLGMIPIYSHKPPPAGVSYTPHVNNMRAIDKFLISTVDHEPENSMSPEQFEANYLGYWNAMKGISPVGPGAPNVWVGPCYMAATWNAAGREAWRLLLDSLPMDVLMVDGYNKRNRRTFANIFKWFGDKAVQRGVPWLVAEVSTHGTPADRAAWVDGMYEWAQRTDAVHGPAAQALRGITWYESDGGQDAGSAGWWAEVANQPGYTDTGATLIGPTMVDVETPARLHYWMDLPRRLLGPEAPPPPPPPEPPDYGALPLGETDYPLPPPGSGPPAAVFVAPPTSTPAGSDSNVGTLAAPVATLGRALALVGANGTVVMREGEYPEANLNGPWGKDNITVQAYPGEAPVLLGSDRVTGWLQDNTGPGGTPRWRKNNITLSFDRTVPDPQLIKAGREEAAWPLLVHVGPEVEGNYGQPLQQVQTLAEVDATSTDGLAGTFWYDVTNRVLWIGTTPFNKYVRVGTRQVAFTAAQGDPGGNPAVHFKGIGFVQYATSQNQIAAFRCSSADTEVENCHFIGCAASGLFFNGTTRPKIIHNDFIDCGQMGLRGYRTTWAEVAYNRFVRNNIKRFASIGAAGGMKFDTDSIALDCHHNQCVGNIGHQLWSDIFDHYAAMWMNDIDGLGSSEAGAGCFLENTLGGLVASNRIKGCVHGVLLSESASCSAWNNTAINCTNSFIHQLGANMPQRTWKGGTWRNNLSHYTDTDPNHRAISYVDAIGNEVDHIEFEWSSDFSAVYRKSDAGDTASITRPGNTRTVYSTLAALNAATGDEANGMESITSGANPWLSAVDLSTPLGDAADSGTAPPDDVLPRLGLDPANRPSTYRIGWYGS